MARLTERQARFVEEYLLDLNATQAAIRAGYSQKSAEKIGHQLLEKTRVREAIAEGKIRRSQRTEISADRVILELARIAFSDPREVMEWGPYGVRLKDSASLTEEQAASVAEVSEGKDGVMKLKKHDKVKALELLGKHIGIFREKVESENITRIVMDWGE